MAAAFFAGCRPAMMPTTVEKTMARTKGSQESMAGIFLTKAMVNDMAIPRTVPPMPPQRVTIKASPRNCCRMSLARAPKARRMPISFFL